MKPDPYLTQILIVVAKGSKPNSPIAERAYMNLKPRGSKIPRLAEARDALEKAGLIERMQGRLWQVRPTRVGYAFFEQWKEDQQAKRARPALFDPVDIDIAVLDQRFNRYAGYAA
jgi:hypothetical protein